MKKKEWLGKNVVMKIFLWALLLAAAIVAFLWYLSYRDDSVGYYSSAPKVERAEMEIGFDGDVMELGILPQTGRGDD